MQRANFSQKYPVLGIFEKNWIPTLEESNFNSKSLMENEGEQSNKPKENDSEGFCENSETIENQNQEQKVNKSMNSESQFFKRKRMRLNGKIKSALVKLNYQKTQFKKEQILQTRKEKLQKPRINYIPLCSDEDWEAMAAFYAKNDKK